MHYTLYSMYVSVLLVDPRMHHEVYFNIRLVTWVYTVFSAFMSYAQLRYYYFRIESVLPYTRYIQALSTVDIPMHIHAKVSIRV